MAVPAAITRIKNIESKPRRTLRNLFLSHHVVQSSVKDGVSSSNAQRLAFVCCYNAAGSGLSMFVLRLIGVVARIVLIGFFAAAEFSLVAVRISRVRQLVAKGNLRARGVETLVGDLRRVVSGVQLGITLCSLAIGALGESSLAKLFQQIWPGTLGTHSALIAHAIALTVAFALLSALHVVLGELVPKTISLARAERVALLIARPFSWFVTTFRWAIDLLDGVSGAIVKALGVTQAQVPSA